MTMRTEPTDKWIRAFVGDVAVVDSRDALLFYEEVFPIPAYAFPREDILEGALRPSGMERPAPGFSGPKGPVSALYDVVVGDRVLEGAAWVRDDPAIDDRMVLTWQPGIFDRWLEEDEVVFAHPRDPHKRVEALPSSRHVQVAIEGTVVADSRSPVLLFETHLPTRYYLARDDVRLDLLTPTTNSSMCPYKGHAEAYWTMPGAKDADNVAWSYADPLPAVARIKDRIAFYNELVDITVDGVLQERPESVFSKRGNRPTS
jgi:uncharacterized protein (DUF427 family)